jgi:integrase
MTDTSEHGRRVRVTMTPAETNRLVKQLCDGKFPDLGGKRERFFYDSQTGLAIRVLASGVASWVVQWKRSHRQGRKTLGRVQVLNRAEAVIADDVGIPTANRCLGFLRVLLKWARDAQGLIPQHQRTAAEGLESLPEKARDRVLTDDEIRLIWKTCEDATAEIKREQEEFASTGRRPRGRVDRVPIFSYIIQLMFLTGCRVGEVSGLQRHEIVRGLDLSHNAGELRIPGTRRKARKKHEEMLTLHVPLAQGAVEILRQIAPRRDGSDYFFGKHGRKTNELRTWIDERIIKAGGTPPPDWHPHDIRRTFRTRLSELSIPFEAKEMLTGHIGWKRQNERTYDRHDFWAEMQHAIDKWERHLRQIIDGMAAEVIRPQFRRHTQ